MAEQERLRLYGQPSEHASLPWEWVDRQLTEAGTYWVVARTHLHPHPRPVWGVWRNGQLHLSIGTPLTRRAVAADPAVTVHLDSGTDVVIVEGRVSSCGGDQEAIADYDRKYDWTYDVGEYGPLTCVEPQTILAWCTAGWAGRDSFRQTGRWRFTGQGPPPADN